MQGSRKDVRRRLQTAALELFLERGYDATTGAEIAARAGVTERTFFRHFPDKREVLFGGEAELGASVVAALLGAPRDLGAWAALLEGFKAAEPVLVEYRGFSEPRRHIIAGSRALQEREVAKAMNLTVELAAALRGRGVSEREASFTAQMAMAAFGDAFSSWLEDGVASLEEHLLNAFRDAHALSAL